MASPSFYTTTKLARIVQRVKDRLKSVRHKAPVRTLTAKIRADNFRPEMHQAMDRNNSPRGSKDRGSLGVHSPASPATNFSRYGPTKIRTTSSTDFRLCSSLFHVLDNQVLQKKVSLLSLSSDDSLFLRHDQYHLPITKDIPKLRQIVDNCNTLLTFVRGISHEHGKFDDGLTGSANLFSTASTQYDFSCEKNISNLEYLILWFRDFALNLLVRHYLDLIEDTLERYQQFWLHKKGALGDWFAEWPNGHRPLSTTWPWNIKPALLVLWGVCWMFYDHEGRNFGPPENYGQDLWTPSQATTQSQPLQQTQAGKQESTFAPGGPAIYPNYSWVNPYQAGAQTRRANEGIPATTPAAHTSASPYSYISVSSDDSSDLFSSPAPEGWPYISGISTASVPAYPQNATFWPSQGTFGSHLPNALPSLDQTTSFHPYALPQARTFQAPRGGTPNRLGFGFGAQRRNMQDYPSPQLSDISGQADPTYAGFQPRIMTSPNSALIKSPSQSRSPTSPQSANRDSEPPRDASGRYYCGHRDCANRPPRFTRKCEWSKHMDKHTRPYICEDPGCENLRGFTYSGGLHRHQREVHRQHGGPRAACYCPHQDCKRSTGVGFSRKENLAEHLRRVHRDTAGDTGVEETSLLTPDVELGEQGLGVGGIGQRKRRRKVNDDDEDEDVEGRSEEKLRLEVKKLKRELAEKDERLRRLEEQVALLARSQRGGAV